MASNRKPSAKKKRHAKSRNRVAKKALREKPARRKAPRAEQRPIYVTYDQSSGSLQLWPDPLIVHKEETAITWLKYAGSDPITFELDPSAQHTPFGTPSPNGTHTQITLPYHGKGTDADLRWNYEARITATGVVTISSTGLALGGARSTIKNH